MPGKVNPVMCESMMQVAARVFGNDTTVAMSGATGGNFQLNVMMPVITHNIVSAIQILTNAIAVFEERCLRGIEADEAMCAHWLERSPALVTELMPKIGYAESARLAKEALATGKTVKQLVTDNKVLEGAELEQVLDLRAMTELGVPGGGKGVPAGG